MAPFHPKVSNPMASHSDSAAREPITPRLRQVLRIRPVGIGGAVRLYAGYLGYVIVQLSRPHFDRPIGTLIPGRKKLEVRVDGIRALIRPGTNDLGILAGTHESTATEWFKPKSGETVVDVGAHIGRYTLLAAKAGARVIAVEPEPANFDSLRANVTLNGFTLVTCLKVALSDTDGRARLYLEPGYNKGSHSMVYDRLAPGTSSRSLSHTEVECHTLDALVRRFDIRAIDWLKVDVEGNEVRVLEGGQTCLKLVSKVMLEVGPGNENACRELLEAAGFRLRQIEKSGIVANWLLDQQEDRKRVPS